MSKYKRKRKKNNTLLVGLIVISVLILISTGYSLWSDVLYIKGSANTAYSEPQLEDITINETEGKHITITEKYFIKALTVNDTSISKDNKHEITANIEINPITLTSRDITISLSFINNYNTTITNGSVEILENTTGNEIETTTITETVADGETAEFNTSFNFAGRTDTSVLKFKVKYNVENVTRYLYITLNFTR